MLGVVVLTQLEEIVTGYGYSGGGLGYRAFRDPLGARIL
jgi:hypothetical protein